VYVQAALCLKVVKVILQTCEWGVAIFGSLVMAGGGGGSAGSDIVQVLSWFCSAWIWSVSWATCSLSDNMVVGSKEVGMRKVGGFEVFFCCQSTS